MTLTERFAAPLAEIADLAQQKFLLTADLDARISALQQAIVEEAALTDEQKQELWEAMCDEASGLSGREIVDLFYDLSDFGFVERALEEEYMAAEDAKWESEQ